MNRTGSSSSGSVGVVMLVLSGIVVLVLLSVLNMNMAFAALDENELGIVTINGVPTETLAAGTHFKWGWRARIYTIDQSARRIELPDVDTFTKDKLIVGITSTFDLLWPEPPQFYLDNWPRYGKRWRDVSEVDERVRDLMLQSYRECVGQAEFDKVVVRDVEANVDACIENNLNIRLAIFGLQAHSVAIPEVSVSEEIQARIDDTAEIALDARKAEAQEDKLKAEADAEVARQEGEIRIANAKKQEEARQLTTLQQLEADRLLAQQKVIDATANNAILQSQRNQEVVSTTKAVEIYTALQDLEVAKLNADIAELEAQAAQANATILAQLYQDNPEYARQLAAEVLAVSLGENNKMIVLGEGSGVNLDMILGDSFRPVFDVNQPEAPTTD